MNFINIRVFFSKTGKAKYISHLDLYRAMGRALKRSELPVWITEGFNPHIYMTFALPLALGIESHEESVDLRLTQELDFTEVTERLKEEMPHGLGINRVAAPVLKANDINKARYEFEGEKELLNDVERYLSRSEIIITKKTKKNTQVIDVKPLLERKDKSLILPAGNTLNINPWNVFDNFSDNGSIRIIRTAILCDNGRVFE